MESIKLRVSRSFVTDDGQSVKKSGCHSRYITERMLKLKSPRITTCCVMLVSFSDVIDSTQINNYISEFLITCIKSSRPRETILNHARISVTQENDHKGGTCSCMHCTYFLLLLITVVNCKEDWNKSKR